MKEICTGDFLWITCYLLGVSMWLTIVQGTSGINYKPPASLLHLRNFISLINILTIIGNGFCIIVLYHLWDKWEMAHFWTTQSKLKHTSSLLYVPVQVLGKSPFLFLLPSTKRKSEVIASQVTVYRCSCSMGDKSRAWKNIVYSLFKDILFDLTTWLWWFKWECAQ